MIATEFVFLAKISQYIRFQYTGFNQVTDNPGRVLTRTTGGKHIRDLLEPDGDKDVSTNLSEAEVGDGMMIRRQQGDGQVRSSTNQWTANDD